MSRSPLESPPQRKGVYVNWSDPQNRTPLIRLVIASKIRLVRISRTRADVQLCILHRSTVTLARTADPVKQVE